MRSKWNVTGKLNLAVQVGIQNEIAISRFPSREGTRTTTGGNFYIYLRHCYFRHAGKHVGYCRLPTTISVQEYIKKTLFF